MSDQSGAPNGVDNPAETAMPHWDQVVDDMAATAEAYREEGWDALEVHPGDIHVSAGEADRTGFDLLVPDNEFEPVAEAVDSGAGFESAEFYRAAPSGTVYVVVALEDAPTETAILFSLYYLPDEHPEFVEMLRSEGEVRTHLRPLDERRILTFTHGDPSHFLPEER